MEIIIDGEDAEKLMAIARALKVKPEKAISEVLVLALDALKTHKPT